MNEKELINSLQQGSESAFYELVDVYKERIFHTCYGFVRNVEEAEDLTQEVFIELYQSVDKFNFKAKLSTWLYRIAVNKSLDLIKYNNRKKRFTGIKQVFGVDYEADSISATEDFEASAEIENRERAKVLQNALNKLPLNQKTAFTLNKYDGMSYAEIAEIMESSVSSIESLIHRAKKKLQKLLYDFYQTEKNSN